MDATAARANTTSSDAADLVSLTDAAHQVTGRPSASAIWRWCRRGVLARDGSRIRLEHRRVGGKIYTSCAWLASTSSVVRRRSRARIVSHASNHAT